MGSFNDLTNMRFGRLTVKYKVLKKERIYWYCECDCGGSKTIRSDALVNSWTKSCGCINNEKKHNMTNPRIYDIWIGIKSRCINENNQAYCKYGGRGITICEEWLNDFMSFYNWSMENGYNDSLSIDRIDNDGNYEPDNCRWATSKEQCNNRSSNHLIEINGITKTVAQWSDLSGVNYNTIIIRYNNGLRGEELLSLPRVAKYKSGVKYVSWNKRNGSWIVKYKNSNGELLHVGCFKNLDEAINKQEEFKSKLI